MPSKYTHFYNMDYLDFKEYRLQLEIKKLTFDDCKLKDFFYIFSILILAKVELNIHL